MPEPTTRVTADPEALRARHAGGLLAGAVLGWLLGFAAVGLARQSLEPWAGTLAHVLLYLGVTAVLLRHGRRLATVDLLGLERPAAGLLRGLVVYALAAGPIWLFGYAWQNWVLPPDLRDTRQETVSRLLQLEDPLELSLLIVTVVVAVPLFEEIVFRGYLLNGLLGVLHGSLRAAATAVTAVLLSSVLFTLMHKPVSWGMIFLVSVVIAELYRRSGSFWAAVSFHAAHNGATVTWMLLSQR